MKQYRIEKGEEGERCVYGIVTEILNEMDFSYKIVRNSYLPYKSVYRENGYIFAELDIVILHHFLFL